MLLVVIWLVLRVVGIKEIGYLRLGLCVSRTCFEGLGRFGYGYHCWVFGSISWFILIHAKRKGEEILEEAGGLHLSSGSMELYVWGWWIGFLFEDCCSWVVFICTACVEICCGWSHCWSGVGCEGSYGKNLTTRELPPPQPCECSLLCVASLWMIRLMVAQFSIGCRCYLGK